MMSKVYYPYTLHHQSRNSHGCPYRRHFASKNCGHLCKTEKTLLIRTAKKSLRCTNANLKISSVGIILSRFPDSWGQKKPSYICDICAYTIYDTLKEYLYRHGQKLEKNKLQKPPNLHSLSKHIMRNAMPRMK